MKMGIFKIYCCGEENQMYFYNEGDCALYCRKCEKQYHFHADILPEEVLKNIDTKSLLDEFSRRILNIAK